MPPLDSRPVLPASDDVMCDIVGPMPSSEGHRYLLTLVCRTSRWLEALPLKEANSATIARAFIHGWVRNFGLPRKLTCDNATTFTSKLWRGINDQLGTIVSYTPIYNPASLGSLERQHSDLKSSLRATLLTMGQEHQGNWVRILPWVLLGRRTSYHGEMKATPAQVVFGEDPVLPGDIIPPMGSGETLDALLTRVKANVNRPPAQTAPHRDIPVYMPPTTTSATHVYTKKPKSSPLNPLYDGPYPITRRLGKSCLELVVGHYNNGAERKEIRHWRSCYPAPTPDCPEEVASKPNLGRKKKFRPEC